MVCGLHFFFLYLFVGHEVNFFCRHSQWFQIPFSRFFLFPVSSLPSLGLAVTKLLCFPIFRFLATTRKKSQFKNLRVVELRYFRVFGLFFGFVVFYSRITKRWMFLLCCLDDGLIFEKSVSQTRLRSLFDKT